MKPPKSPEEHQTEGPPDNPATIVATRRETHFAPQRHSKHRLGEPDLSFRDIHISSVAQTAERVAVRECENAHRSAPAFASATFGPRRGRSCQPIQRHPALSPGVLGAPSMRESARARTRSHASGLKLKNVRSRLHRIMQYGYVRTKPK
jgi:hypothetical protein